MKKTRNYFITPTRLTKYDHFHKTIDMMKTLNPGQSIMTPQYTIDWLNNGNWHKITTKNAAMCLDYMSQVGYNHSSKFQWSENVEAANKIFNILLDEKREEKMVLGESELYEDRLTQYIEQSFDEKLKAAHTDYKKYDHYYSSNDIAVSLLRNGSLKVYQYEMIFNKVRAIGLLKPLVSNFSGFKVKEIPDYILEVLIDSPEDSSYYSSSLKTKLLEEAIIRRMLVRQKLSVPVVKSQSKPLPKAKTLNKPEKEPTKMVYRTFTF